MERITFEVKNHSDAQQLVEFARRIGSTVVAESKESRSKATDKSRAIIDRGCDISSFGNPSDWQRETRIDRPLPFRVK